MGDVEAACSLQALDSVSSSYPYHVALYALTTLDGRRYPRLLFSCTGHVLVFLLSKCSMAILPHGFCYHTCYLWNVVYSEPVSYIPHTMYFGLQKYGVPCRSLACPPRAAISTTNDRVRKIAEYRAHSTPHTEHLSILDRNILAHLHIAQLLRLLDADMARRPPNIARSHLPQPHPSITPGRRQYRPIRRTFVSTERTS